ncbi:hypothetical protein ACKZDW_13385 [Ralstonia syzygii subsp. celebesensis]|uniref:hypothetical protein n=1 Tax=Ralstonia syzygii TaxID=28097 RepID=UPI00387E202F
MKLTTHTTRDYIDALKALLPPGAAWEWPEGGMGDAMLGARPQSWNAWRPARKRYWTPPSNCTGLSSETGTSANTAALRLKPLQA